MGHRPPQRVRRCGVTAADGRGAPQARVGWRRQGECRTRDDAERHRTGPAKHRLGTGASSLSKERLLLAQARCSTHSSRRASLMTDTNTDIRVALIGYGLGGQSFHAPVIATTPGMRLAAIVTGHADRQRQATAEYPDARIVGSAEDLFRDPPRVDLAGISTPNRTHVPLP